MDASTLSPSARDSRPSKPSDRLDDAFQTHLATSSPKLLLENGASPASIIAQASGASPIRPSGTYQATPFSTNSLFVAVDLKAAEGVQFLGSLAANALPSLRPAVDRLGAFIESNPDINKALAFEVDTALPKPGAAPLSGESDLLIQVKLKPQYLANLAPAVRDEFINLMSAVNPKLADEILAATKAGPIANTDVRITGNLKALLAGGDPKWRTGIMWVGGASIPNPLAGVRGLPNNLGAFAYATVRNHDGGLNPLGDNGSLQIITGVGFVGPKVGPLNTIAFTASNGFIYNETGPRSASADVRKQAGPDGQPVYGAEVQVGNERYFLPFPGIRGAVDQLTGGDPSKVASSTLPSLTDPSNQAALEQYTRSQLALVPPDVADRLANAAGSIQNLGGAIDALDIASTILGPPLATLRSGPIGGAFAAYQSLQRVKNKEIEFLLSQNLEKPENIADLIFDAKKNTGSSEIFADLGVRLKEAIDQGLQIGTLKFQDTLRAWKEVADHGYRGPGAEELFNSPQVDGPPPFTKGQLIQDFAKRLIYGDGSALVGEPSLLGGIPAETNQGFAYYGKALNMVENATKYVAQQAGIPADQLPDFSTGDIRGDIGSGLNFLYQHDRAMHDQVVAKLANNEGEDFGWGPLKLANDNLPNWNPLRGAGQRVQGSLDPYNIESYTHLATQAPTIPSSDSDPEMCRFNLFDLRYFIGIPPDCSDER